MCLRIEKGGEREIYIYIEREREREERGRGRESNESPHVYLLVYISVYIYTCTSTQMIDAGTWPPRLSAATPLPLERPEIVVQRKKKFSNPFLCQYATKM